MKVAYLLGSLNRGGMESLLYDVARHHYKAPFEMVFVHRKGGTSKEEFYGSGVGIIQLSPNKGRLMSYLISLSRVFTTQRVDVVHTQMTIDCIYAHLAIQVGKILGIMHHPIQIITTFHGFDIGDGVINRLCRKLAIKFADKVCFVSQYEREYYERRYNVGNKGYVIYNGVDFSKIENNVHHSSVFSPMSPNVKLCMVGSFGGGRSHIVICKAFQHLKAKDTHWLENIDFYFIGARRTSEPHYYDECVAYCKMHGLDNVHFWGGRNDVPQLLQQMDGFVYSTVHDTFGIAVVEAMAVGLPVIVNDWEVMKEVTHNGEWATLFKTEDIEDCANKIEDLVAHLQERKAKAQQIAKEVREEYSIERHIERLNEIYNTIGQ